MAGPDRVIHVANLSLIERFASVLYPLDLGELLQWLPEAGWVVPQASPEESVRGQHELATKGNTRLSVDMGNKTVGVRGDDLAETIANFRELRERVHEWLDVESKVTTDYVELRYVGWINGQSSPIETFHSWWADSQLTGQLGAFLGERLPSDSETMSPYGIRFASGRLDANRSNWSELTITPASFAGNRRFHFDLIYRNQDPSATEGVAEAANDLLTATLERLENP